MPKKATSNRTPDTSDSQLAIKAICAITGCGVCDARKRFAQLSEDQQAKVIELESNDKRKQIVKLLNS